MTLSGKKPKAVRPHSGLATGDCRNGAPLDQKCEWMRARQELKRRVKRSRHIRMLAKGAIA